MIKKFLRTWWLQDKKHTNSVYSNNSHTIDDMKMAVTEYIWNVDCAILNMVSENTVRRFNKCLETGGGGTLNISSNFLYCDHQVHGDFLITLYILIKYE
jgi:hypothetical protein